jgi:predicted amidophosphoribosyltransferase
MHAALPYESGGRDLVLAYKDHGNRALAPMLGTLLADAIDDALSARGLAVAQIVPVPPHPGSERGFDAVSGILRGARRELLERGLAVRTVRPVRACGRVRMMKSLSGQERRRQADALFRPARFRAVAADPPVVVVDDVITTGSTVEAMRSVLAAMGATVVAAAAVAAVGRPDQPG